MFRRSKLKILNQKDDPVKIINERIINTEKHLIGMCAAFAENTRQIAKQRNTVDLLSRVLKGYADDDGVNESFNEGLKNIAKILTSNADHMDLSIRRLEAKIIHELATLDGQCKLSREEIRSAGVARDKEVLKQRQVMELKTKFSANSSATDSDLAKAKQEVLRSNKQIEELIINFEKRKLTTIKQILNDYIMISIKYHTKALEVLTQGYFDVLDIDEDGDIVDFQKLFKTEEEPTSTATQKKKLRLKKLLKSKSMESLEREEAMSPLRAMGKFSKSTKSLSTTKSDDDAKTDRKNKNITDDDESWDSNEEEDDIEEEATDDENVEENDEETEDDERSISSTEDEALATPKNIQESPPGIAKSNMFGIRKSKPRSEIKHPFKAVAAAHVFSSKKLNQQSPKISKTTCKTRIHKGSSGIKRSLLDGLGKSNGKTHKKKDNESSASISPRESVGSVASFSSRDEIKSLQPSIRIVESNFRKNLDKNFRELTSAAVTVSTNNNDTNKNHQ